MKSIDWFLQRGIANRSLDPADLARGRFLVGLLGVACLASLFFTAQTVVGHGPVAFKVVSLVTFLGYAIALAFLRRTADVVLISKCWALFVSLALLGSGYFGAGYQTILREWSLALVLIITYLAGFRAGVFACIGIVAGAGGLLLLEKLGLHQPDMEALRFMNDPVMHFSTSTINLASVLVVSGLFERAQRHARAQLQGSLEELHATQHRLMDASRRAGMAEVASNVLHNVGNALNSVNVSATLVADSLAASRVSRLPKVVELLESLGVEKKPVEYLRQLAVVLGAENAAAQTELEGLRKNIEHIKVIVSTQQTHARASAGMVETLPLGEILEEALRIHGGGSLQNHHSEVVREYHEAPAISVDKHKLIQILVNLLTNAQQAMMETSLPERRIVVRSASPSAGAITIEVQDTGCGILPANLEKIFSHGFTTKKDGHGFGLHASALAARELGGRLRCRSDGPGHGATFSLELPTSRQ